MATHIAISAGGAAAADGSNVNLAFDGSSAIVVSAHSATPPAAGNLITAANCTWTVLDVPKGTAFDAAWFNTNTASWPNVNTFPTVTNFVPDKEGTWLFRCTNSDGTVDEVAVGVRHQRTNIRVPAAGETTEANSTRGWAESRNDDLDVFDDLVTSGGVQRCRFVSSGTGAAGTLVQFNGDTFDINPTSGATEFVPTVEPASNSNPGVGRYVGVIKAKKDGTTTSIASGSLVWVSRAGMVEGSTSNILDLSGFAVGDSVYVGSSAGLPASSTDVDTATATLAGIVVRAENPGAILVTPVSINNVLTTKASGTARDTQIVEVDIFEAPISGHNLYNTSTDSSSANRGFVPYGGSSNAPLDLPGARFQNKANATESFLTSIAIDERCVREGASGGVSSNWMEYPLVLQVYGYSADHTVGTAVPAISAKLSWNFSGVAGNNTTEAQLSPVSVQFYSPTGEDLVYGGSTSSRRELVFMSPLTINASGTTSLDFPYYGNVGNDFDNLSAVAETAYDTPPCGVDLLLQRSDSGTFDIVITKVVLKALYPAKSRAKRLSFYEKQIPGAALVDSTNSTANGVINYGSSTGSGIGGAEKGGPFVNAFESDASGDDFNDFGKVSVSANMRGQTAATLVGYFPFDNRLRLNPSDTNAATQTRTLRLRTISKYKSENAGAHHKVKLKLTARGESSGEEFVATSVSSGKDYENSVEVTGAVLTPEDDYRTIVHDFNIDADDFDPDIDGIRFKIERVVSGSDTYKTTDNKADTGGSATEEEAFCISSVLLSERGISVSKAVANVFETSIPLERQIDYNDGASNMTLNGECPGFLFTKGASETLVVPIVLDERYDEQSDLTVDITGYVTGAAGFTPGGSVTLRMTAASAYLDELVTAFSAISDVSVDTSAALTGSNTQRILRHRFTVPFSTIAKAAGIPDANLSIPLENRRSCLYLKVSRADTDGPTSYLANHLSAVASINKVPNADPYVNISENASFDILVPGAYIHDQQRDILTTAYRHNWQFGLINEHRETGGGGDGGIAAGKEAHLLPTSLLSNTPPTLLGILSTQGGVEVTGGERLGKHIPFSFVITAVHGYMISGQASDRDSDGVNDEVNGHGIGPDTFIELRIFEAPNSGNSTNSFTQNEITSDNNPGVIGFPFKIFPNATATNKGGGIFRMVGSDLSTNANAHDGTTLPRIYLPQDYADERQYVLCAAVNNISGGSQIVNPLVDLNIEVAFLPNTTGLDLIY